MGRRIGRPPVDNPKNYTLCARITYEQHMKLTDFCKKHNISKSVVTTYAIGKYIDSLESNKELT